MAWCILVESKESQGDQCFPVVDFQMCKMGLASYKSAAI